ncbi:MAG: hypothetical protein K8R91_03540 [Phycisphaerae bacterium]|nr:hypothetical protein [Phycisphaerae bacterium]
MSKSYCSTRHPARYSCPPAGCRPRRSLGQNFLIDAKLMGKLLELADLPVVSAIARAGVMSQR